MSKNKILWMVFSIFALLTISAVGFIIHLNLSKPILVEGSIVKPVKRNRSIDEKSIQVIRDYIDSLFGADLDRIYGMLNIKEETILNTKEHFIKKHKENIQSIDYDKMSIVKSGKSFLVTYNTKDNHRIQSYEIELEGNKIIDPNLLAEDYKVIVPEGYTLYMDDILIDASYIVPMDEEEALYDRKATYYFPSMLLGTYDLKVTSEYIEDYLKEVTLKDGWYREEEIYDFDFELKDTFIEELKYKSAEIVIDTYEAAFARQGFDAISHHFNDQSEYIDSIRQAYEEINIRREENDYGLMEMRLFDWGHYDSFIYRGHIRTIIIYDAEIYYRTETGTDKLQTTEFDGSENNMALFEFALINEEWKCDEVYILLKTDDGDFSMMSGQYIFEEI